MTRRQRDRARANRVSTTGASFTVADVVRRWADETPSATALICQGSATTWRELRDRSARVAAALEANGIGPGDRVAFLDKNGPQYFEVLFGAAMLNAVTVAVNWRLAVPEVVGVINDAEAKALVVGPEWLELVKAGEPDLVTVKPIVAIGGDGEYEQYERWLAPHAPRDPYIPSDPNDVAMQLYTSGTTGVPKGAMLTNAGLGGFMAYAQHLGIDQASVVMAAMPLFHIAGGGWALVAMTAGAHTVVVRDFDAATVLELIARHRVTHSLFVPAMLLFMTQAADVEHIDLSSLRLIMYGASPMSEELLQTCMGIFDCDFCQTYGLTETSGAVTMLAPEDHLDVEHRERLRSAGRPMGDVELRIVDPDTGAEVDEGAIGEVWLRSVQVMKGYWHNETETARAITEDGWFKTGDAGYCTEGYLYLHDRIKDLIVSGGENVYPAEVENVLAKHPAVADVAVIGVPSDTWGEEVKAIVVADGGRESDPAELITFARAHLAGYKVPKSIDFTRTLPRTPSGKLLKKDLRAAYWAGRHRQIG